MVQRDFFGKSHLRYENVVYCCIRIKRKYIRIHSIVFICDPNDNLLANNHPSNECRLDAIFSGHVIPPIFRYELKSDYKGKSRISNGNQSRGAHVRLILNIEELTGANVQ